LVVCVHNLLRQWFRAALFAVLLASGVLLAPPLAPPLAGQQQGGQPATGLPPAFGAQDSTEPETEEEAQPKPPTKRHPLRNTPARYTPLIVWREAAVEAAAFSLIAALLLSLPIAGVYRLTTPASEFDQSIAHSILVLPATVAGIILVVQNSLALAFSLAGVVTAVRFRSSLKDTNDAVYIFLSVAIGVAAGARAFDIAVVVCTIVCLALLLIRAPRFLLVRPRLAPVLPSTATGGDPKGDDGTGEPSRIYTVLVHSGNIGQMQPAVEQVLTELTKGYQLTASGPASGGVSRLVYAVRLKKKFDARELEAALNDVAAQNGGHADVTTGPASEAHAQEWEASENRPGGTP
jgi:hypothetical protein